MRWQMMFDRVSTSGDIKDKINKKFSGLETYLGKMKDRMGAGFVSLAKGERFGYRVKAMLHLPGREIVAEGRSKTLLSAIDEAYSRSAREIKRYLGKLRDRKKR